MSPRVPCPSFAFRGVRPIRLGILLALPLVLLPLYGMAPCVWKIAVRAGEVRPMARALFSVHQAGEEPAALLPPKEAPLGLRTATPAACGDRTAAAER